VYAVNRDRITCLGVFGTFLPFKNGSQHFANGLPEQQGHGSKGLMSTIVVSVEVASLMCRTVHFLPDSMLQYQARFKHPPTANNSRNLHLLLSNDELLLIALCNNLTRFSEANTV